MFISVRKWTLFLTFLKFSKIFAPDVNELFSKILTVAQMIQPTLKQTITTHFLSLSPFRNSTWLPCSEIFQLIQKWHKVTHFDTIIWPYHGFIARNYINYCIWNTLMSRQKGFEQLVLDLNLLRGWKSPWPSSKYSIRVCSKSSVGLSEAKESNTWSTACAKNGNLTIRSPLISHMSI